MSKSHEHSKEDASQAYGEYLVLLQERNRLLKKLRAKDSKQQELERREQGFSLYLNGANVDLRLNGSPPKKSSRKSKTAGDYGVRRMDVENDEDGTDLMRTLTAPSKTTRKNWGSSNALKIKTESGATLEVTAPDKFSGKYSEDFELYESYLEAKLEEEELSDAEENTDVKEKTDVPDISVATDERDDSGTESDQGEEDEHLTFTLMDVKALRESLENDEEIARSIKEAVYQAESNTECVQSTQKSEEDGSLATNDVSMNRSESQKQEDVKAKPENSEDEITEEIVLGNESTDPDSFKVQILGEGSDTIGQELDNYKHIRGKLETQTRKGPSNIVSTRETSSGFEYMSTSKVVDEITFNPKVTQIEEVQTFHSMPSRPRPLSASRKKVEISPSNITTVKQDEVLSAIVQENQSVVIDKRNSKTAPVLKQLQTPPSHAPRAGSADTGVISTETIFMITEKVKKLNSKQQVRLLNMLSKIETLNSDDSSVLTKAQSSHMHEHVDNKSMSRESNIAFTVKDKTNIQSGTKSPVVSEKGVANNNLLCSVPLTLQEENGCSIPNSGRSGVHEPFSETDEADIMEVMVEVLTNWGHDLFTGATEFQFFNASGEILNVPSDHVELTSDHVTITSPSNLVNGKTKTVKDRFMWKCKNKLRENVELMFYVPVSKNHEPFKLQKIAIWNYNRSLKELSIGIKDIRIFVGGQLIWTGIVDKGCGNKMFNYSKEIILRQKTMEASASFGEQMFDPVVRCETRTLVRDHHDIEGLPIVDMESPQLKSPSPQRYHETSTSNTNISVDRNKTDNSQCTTHSKTKNLEQDDASNELIVKYGNKNSAALYRSKSISTPNLTSLNVMADHSQKGAEGVTRESIRARSRGEESGTPIWLTEGRKSHSRASSSASVSSVVDDPFNIASDRAAPSSGRRSAQGYIDQVRSSSSSTNKVISSGRRAGSARGNYVPEDLKHERALSTPKVETLPTVLDDNSHSTKATCTISRTSTRSPDMSRSRKQSSGSRLSKLDQEGNLDLEQSLKCIDKFEKDHRGRITKDIDLSEEGDIMDDLLKPTRKGQSVAQGENSKAMHEEDTEVATEMEPFQIPVLPKGSKLTINIISTWGDRHYVGLNGIEIFESSGQVIKDMKVSASPPDINILPEYDNDPRVIGNIIDGVYMTRDDMHLWLTPFTAGQSHFIHITFEKNVTIAMIRMWNYNKSRIHSFRGVKDVQITLDDVVVFRGEIARASGSLSKSAEPYGDIILFTMDEDILEAVSENDFLLNYNSEEEDQLLESMHFYRPKTADVGDNSIERPLTSAEIRDKADMISNIPSQVSYIDQEDGEQLIPEGCCIQLNFIETWGDPHYLGLTGLEILDKDYESIPIAIEMVSSCPRDLNDLPDVDDDDRTLDKLFDGMNVTMSDEHMWLIPFTDGEDHVVTISFPSEVAITGFRVWNYNKSLEDTYRGAKLVHVAIDGNIISPDGGYLLRKGPGQCHFDFAQDILFAASATSPSGISTGGLTNAGKRRPPSDCESLTMPTGFVFQLRIFTSWGDPYYVGLNGIQLYDDKFKEIELTPNNITAYPHSVNVLDETINDIRTPDKLIDGVNDTYDGRHMWLAPIFPGQINIVYVVFDQPVTVSMIKLWNYSKSPGRGAQQFGLFVDDLLVYNGVLPRVDSHTKGILPTIDMPVLHHTILFTDNDIQVMAEKKYVLMNSNNLVEQDIQLTNDRSVINPRFGGKPQGKSADPLRRPMTSITGNR